MRQDRTHMRRLLLIAAVSALENKYSMRSNNPMVTLGRISLTLLMLHVPLFRDLSQDADLHKGDYNIHWLEHWLDRTYASPDG